MSYRVILTDGLTVTQWTDANGLYLDKFGSIPRLDDGDWQRWGANLLNLPSIHGICLPDPYQFSDWRRWADRVNEALSTLS